MELHSTNEPQLENASPLNLFDSQQEKEPGITQNNKASGRWTKEEHKRFVEALKRFGKDWKKVEDFVGTRSSAQIRSHAQKFFNRLQREYVARSGGDDCDSQTKNSGKLAHSTKDPKLHQESRGIALAESTTILRDSFKTNCDESNRETNRLLNKSNCLSIETLSFHDNVDKIAPFYGIENLESVMKTIRFSVDHQEEQAASYLRNAVLSKITPNSKRIIDAHALFQKMKQNSSKLREYDENFEEKAPKAASLSFSFERYSHVMLPC